MECASVRDWEQAQVDWAAGTVAGLISSGGGRTRLPIELRWREIERVMDALRNEMQREKVAALPHAAATQDDRVLEAAAWMRGYARAYIDARKAKPTRDDTEKCCQQDLRVPHDVARAAWQELPPEFKNPPRTPTA